MNFFSFLREREGERDCICVRVGELERGFYRGFREEERHGVRWVWGASTVNGSG